MKLEMKCACGAEIKLESDERIVFMSPNPTKAKDEEGRRFMVEIIADRWTEHHQSCATYWRYVQKRIGDRK